MKDLTSFAAIIGSHNVLLPEEGIASFQIDGRSEGGSALAVLRPGTTSEVSDVVRLAAASGIILVPQGANTGLVGAGLPDEGGEQVILSLTRLAGVPQIDFVNRSARVDAGVRLSSLNQAAAAYGLTFPIDLGADPSIGGMVAANTGGARFLRHGDVRQNLLGLEVVLADGKGTVIDLGGHLWKNNVGLDLKQILVGASGSLGVVTSAIVALQPLPRAQVTVFLALNDADAALALLMLLERSFGTLLSAFEGISGAALALVFAHIPKLRNPFATIPAYALLIEISGGEVVSEAWIEDRLAEILAEPIENGAILDTATDRNDKLWSIRHAVPEALRLAGNVIACDIALRRGDVFAFRANVRTVMTALLPSLMLCDFGHVGDGGLHFNMVWPRELGAMPTDIADRARKIVFDAVVERGGTFSAEHGIGPRNARYYVQHVRAPVRQLAGRVQRLFAPQRIGRVDFGEGVIGDD